MIPVICAGGYDAEKLAMVKESGFGHIELNFGALALMKDEEIGELLATIHGLGLTVVAGNGFFPWSFKPEKGFFHPGFDIGEIKEYITMAFEKTACISWQSIAFGSGSFRRMPEGYDKEKAKDIFCGVICDIVVPCLEKYNAVLSIEELNSNETNFLNSCRDTLEIVKKVNHPGVGILCDYYHMSLAGETEKDVPDFADYITHLHIASPSNARRIPLEGDSDNDNYTAFFDALKSCGYKKKYLSVEGAFPEDRDLRTALCDCYGYLASKRDAF